MAKYTGGMQVGSGYYFNSSNWEVEVVPPQGARLKADSAARYVKVPFPALFVIVPTLGALFLMFLPMIGFALFAYAIAKKLAGAFTQGATELAATVQPGTFAAGSAYFTGKPEEKKEGAPEDAKGPELEKLERENRGPQGRREVTLRQASVIRGAGESRPRSRLDGFRSEVLGVEMGLAVGGGGRHHVRGSRVPQPEGGPARRARRAPRGTARVEGSPLALEPRGREGTRRAAPACPEILEPGPRQRPTVELRGVLVEVTRGALPPVRVGRRRGRARPPRRSGAASREQRPSERRSRYPAKRHQQSPPGQQRSRGMLLEPPGRISTLGVGHGERMSSDVRATQSHRKALLTRRGPFRIVNPREFKHFLSPRMTQNLVPEGRAHR